MSIRNRLERLEKATGGTVADGRCRCPAPLWRALRAGETLADAARCPVCGLPYRAPVKLFLGGISPDDWDESEATGEPAN